MCSVYEAERTLSIASRIGSSSSEVSPRNVQVDKKMITHALSSRVRPQRVPDDTLRRPPKATTVTELLASVQSPPCGFLAVSSLSGVIWRHIFLWMLRCRVNFAQTLPKLSVMTSVAGPLPWLPVASDRSAATSRPRSAHACRLSRSHVRSALTSTLVVSASASQSVRLLRLPPDPFHRSRAGLEQSTNP